MEHETCQHWDAEAGNRRQDTSIADQLNVIQAVHNGRCNGHTDNTSSFDLDNCQAYLTGWIILFGGIQLLLSQVKDFHSLW